MDDRESFLERVNMHLDNMLNKADKDNTLLRHMARHYRAQNLSLRARIRSLKAKLRKATKREKREKEKDRLRILAEASLTQHSTQISKNLGKSQKNWANFGQTEIFWAKNRDFLAMRRAPCATLKF